MNAFEMFKAINTMLKPSKKIEVKYIPSEIQARYRTTSQRIYDGKVTITWQFDPLGEIAFRENNLIRRKV